MEGRTRTISVEEMAVTLGLGRTAAYNLANRAADNPEMAPFSVVRLGGKLLVSKKSFDAFLEQNDL